MFTICIRDGDTYYRARVSLNWAKRHDNGAMVSIGLTVGVDLSRAAFERLGSLKPLTKKQYEHSGCQSSCTLRGDAKCSW